jgi:hypothetical protein
MLGKSNANYTAYILCERGESEQALARYCAPTFLATHATRCNYFIYLAAQMSNKELSSIA